MSKTNPFSVTHEDHSPGFLLWKTTTIWQRLVKKALEPSGISHAQFVLLASLLWFDLQKKKLTQVDLIDSTKLDKMTVSSSLKKLVTLGLVSRVENQEDTRAKLVSLTSKGKSLAKKLVPVVEKVDKEFFAELKKTETKELCQLFKKVLSQH